MASLVRCWALALLSTTGFLLSGGNPSPVLGQDCEAANVIGVWAACLDFIKKEGPEVAPSAQCCKLIEFAGIRCVCKFVNEDVESVISVERLIHAAKTCGQPARPGSKCGSYKVPPVWY